MSEMIKVAIDAMGGDNAPGEIVKGAVASLAERTDIQILLVGQEDKIQAELNKHEYKKERIQIVPATQVIEMAEHPVAAIRSKKDSSLVVGMKLVHGGEADAFISAGNSGAVLVGGQVIVGRLKGIDRPPFASIIPTQQGVSLLLDCGANVDARPDHLVKFAQIGSIYMKNIVGIKNPKVGILNIGAEEEKGNALVKETFPLLKECEDINFVGSFEARDIPFGGCDVVVAEGFAGNVALKVYEGTASMLIKELKKSALSSLRSKIGALLLKPALKGMMGTFNADSYGGAPLLGLKGLVVKTHGNAKAGVITNSILQCAKFQDEHMTEKIKELIAEQKEENVD